MKKIRPYILGETNWKHLKDEKIELAILPWGATEAHNYHLPYATDVYEADFVAAESARIAWKQGAKALVLPAIPFGVNTGQSDIYLDINLNPRTQFAILEDIITVLNRQGIKKLLVVNSHGGNDFKPLLRELGLKFPEMFLSFTNWFQHPKKMNFFEEKGDHADEMETSLILHMHPELVLDQDDWGEGRERKNKIRHFREGWVWTERKWSEATIDTGIGNPKLATAEKGQKFVEMITQELAELICKLCKTDTNDLYED